MKNKYAIIRVTKEEFHYASIEEMQRNFFEYEMLEDFGEYHFKERGIDDTKQVTRVLFDYDNYIIASADYKGKVKFPKEVQQNFIAKNKKFGGFYLLTNIKTCQPFRSMNQDLFEWSGWNGQGSIRYPININEEELEKKLNIPRVGNKKITFTKTPLFKSFKDYINRSNLLEQLDLYNFENIHSYFLCSVLKENNIYHLKEEPFRMFLNLLKQKKEKNLKHISIEEATITELEIHKQFYLKEKEKNKIPDLFATFKINGKPFTLLLEAKYTNSEERIENGEYQCEVYYKRIEKDYMNTKHIYVFLALDPNNTSQWKSKEKVKAIKDNFVGIDYQDLINSIYNPCYKLTNNSLLLEYMKSFDTLLDPANKNHQLKIPISPIVENYVREIYNNYENECIAILNKEMNSKEYIEDINYLKKFFIALENVINNGKDEELLYKIKRFCYLNSDEVQVL